MRDILTTNVLIIFLFTVISFASCSKNTAAVTTIPYDTTTNQPVLMGRLIFHSYSCYSCNDSKLYLYNFAGKKLTLISSNWSVINAMNAHFSTDGNRIVFMGINIARVCYQASMD